ncbi:Glycophorin-C [Plecturocebus cupreus]
MQTNHLPPGQDLSSLSQTSPKTGHHCCQLNGHRARECTEGGSHPPTISRGFCSLGTMDGKQTLGRKLRKPDPGMASASTTTDIAIIAGVIAAVAIVLVCLLIVMLHYMCRHKGTYHTNEAKGTEFAESADVALQGDPALQDAGDSSRKEYFI